MVKISIEYVFANKGKLIGSKKASTGLTALLRVKKIKFSFLFFNNFVKGNVLDSARRSVPMSTAIKLFKTLLHSENLASH